MIIAAVSLHKLSLSVMKIDHDHFPTSFHIYVRSIIHNEIIYLIIITLMSLITNKTTDNLKFNKISSFYKFLIIYLIIIWIIF